MSQPKSTRRRFLKGGAAVDAVAAWADGTTIGDGDASLGEPSAKQYLVSFARRAMATTFEVLFDARRYPHGGEAAMAALDLVEALEEQLTAYRATSEVMRINRLAHEGPVPVEPRLFALLQQAARLYERTAGAFDVTAGPLAKAWGFYRRQGAIPTADDLAVALAKVGMRHVTLDEESRTIELAVDGMEINLGAIGKGYALDRAAEVLAAAGIEDFLLHGGASSVLVRGSRINGATTASAGWPIGIGDPQRPGERLAIVNVRDRAVGTSGAAYQSFRHQGKRYGHILDPRTGFPADGVLSATVVAPTAAEADALSTALYVLGPDEAGRFLDEHREIAAVLVLPGERPGEARLSTWNFGDGELTLCGDS